MHSRNPSIEYTSEKTVKMTGHFCHSLPLVVIAENSVPPSVQSVHHLPDWNTRSHIRAHLHNVIKSCSSSAIWINGTAYVVEVLWCFLLPACPDAIKISVMQIEQR